MEKIEFGKVITEESIMNGKIVSCSKSARSSHKVTDKYDAQSRMLEASKYITDDNREDVLIRLVGDGKKGIKRMEVTVLIEKNKQ